MEHDTLRQAQAQTLPLQSANFRALQLTPTLVLISSGTSPWTLEQTGIWSCTVQLSRYLSWIKGLIWLLNFHHLMCVQIFSCRSWSLLSIQKSYQWRQYPFCASFKLGKGSKLGNKLDLRWSHTYINYRNDPVLIEIYRFLSREQSNIQSCLIRNPQRKRQFIMSILSSSHLTTIRPTILSKILAMILVHLIMKPTHG